MILKVFVAIVAFVIIVVGVGATSLLTARHDGHDDTTLTMILKVFVAFVAVVLIVIAVGPRP